MKPPLIARLRTTWVEPSNCECAEVQRAYLPMLKEAAAALEAQAARIAELEAALESIAAQSSNQVGSFSLVDCMAAVARAALAKQP